MKITVKYFGSVKDDAGTEQEDLHLDEVTSVSEVILRLKETHSGLSRRKGQILFALNQNYSSEDSIVKEGDELALFPVVSGG